MCDYTEDPGGREAAMVRLSETVWCDPCLTPLVKALNDGGIHTVASCCGHEGRNSGHGNIVLANGRVLAILPDLDYLSRVNTASALLAAAEHRIDEAEERIKAVRDVHYQAHNDRGRTPFCPDCKGAPGVHECGCWRDEWESPVCGHCRGWKGVGPVEWPCPTIKALDA